jgi:hypothetical protein
MMVDYMVDGDSFVAGEPRFWYENQIFYAGNLNQAPDGNALRRVPHAGDRRS